MWIATACLVLIPLFATDDAAPPDLGAILAPDAVGKDLDELQRIIDRDWLLSNLNQADFSREIASMRTKPSRTTAEFALELQRLLALGADGHAISSSLYPAMRRISDHVLPFTLEALGDRCVAIDPSSSRRNQLWNPDFPYVSSIDGLPAERWVQAAMPLVARSNPLSTRAMACNLVRNAGYLRTLLGIKDSPRFMVELEAVDGKKLSVNVESAPERFSLFRYNLFLDGQASKWQITESRIGYLWLSGAPDQLGARLVEAMAKFRETRGLVIDLRRNDGGAGETLNLLGIWLAGGSTPRHLAGVLRVLKGEPTHANFFVQSSDSTELSPEGKALAATWLDGLPRTWKSPTRIPTTDYCVMLAPPAVEPHIKPYSFPEFERLVPSSSIYHYDKPVVLLIDRHCFSAAELLIEGVRGLPNVRVVGEPTRGGSGASGFFRLPESGLEILVTSKSVYLTPTGKPIDGIGCLPDVPVDVDLVTITGPGDTMLDRAMDEIESMLAGRTPSPLRGQP